MEVFYNGKLIKDGEFLKISETQIEAKIKLHIDPNKFYTLIMYDPDAISGTFIHWLKTNITNNNIKTGNILIPYKGPAPPPKTGKHRYIFELYNQNGENKIDEIEPNGDWVDKRVISIDLLRNKLGISNPIFKIKFISENKSGGSKRKTKKKSKRNKKTRRYL